MHPAPHADARRRIVDDLVARGAVAVVRLPDAERALAVVDALAAGGVTAIELTLTTPGALELIATLRKAGGDALLVGAGSVLDADTARRAVEAGATYVVSPVFRAEVVAESHRQGVPAMPGAYTPTEILTAHEAGADVVKVFPADTLGPAYLKGVMAPMPFLRLMPTGGVTPANVGDWLRAGAVAAGLGSALVDAKLVAANDMAAITARARQTSENVAAVRGALTGVGA
ncbi:bifunctional 4-hydroxy-2-oxoglutarate aldolase/2-dehydro-3-deoxy-phosphogluconate aldolase [Roseisolibacter agri]|uniref:2-dehydro-3-deoxy-phosphogluconate aldolase n=1 Tax=Roseisolibacter agri TaxID=2014610 RepID=A0AA37VDI8_9BACT|nr:bifunctional 4-hydroxy-2-oxoglutarate aldolase/2-dehydro-3-deoxy-phosphogluconate aldolase [Roseisolibacter agri]GLC23744.1 2-dehydro-3-deoxy-phosphogluconate aldolase [Roseisolibacter agri]